MVLETFSSISVWFYICDTRLMYAWLPTTGQPKRHLLTTGWSVFVSAKRLTAGDSVLFIRYIYKMYNKNVLGTS